MSIGSRKLSSNEYILKLFQGELMNIPHTLHTQDYPSTLHLLTWYLEYTIGEKLRPAADISSDGNGKIFFPRTLSLIISMSLIEIYDSTGPAKTLKL